MRIIFTSLLFSQIFILGVFWVSPKSYYVVEPDKNLCGEFIPGNAQSPNWLPDTWKSIALNDDDISTERYCKDNGYRYAGIKVWVQYISESRTWAEFLAWKNIIEKQNLNPQAYNLDTTITRKEMMKIISNLWNIDLEDIECELIFSDVVNDWGCKYIESALERGYIAWNEWFRPDDAITRSEALKLIFKAKNIEKRYNTSVWQEDYISSAYYLWYLDEKFNNYNIPATRWWIFSVTAKTYPEFSKY